LRRDAELEVIKEGNAYVSKVFYFRVGITCGEGKEYAEDGDFYEELDRAHVPILFWGRSAGAGAMNIRGIEEGQAAQGPRST